MSIFLRSFWATVSLGLAVSVMIGLVLSPGTIRANANEPPQFSLQWDSSGSSIDLATDSLGNVYALGYSGQIEKFDSNGTFITNWGSQATGGISAPNGGFYFPESIAADSENNVYVADTGNHRIQKFDSNGTFITKWGGSGNADGRFQFPQGIAVDSENNVYVADTENNRIQKFDSNGTFITKWGSEVVEGEEFMPRSLTVSDNHVFSTNYSNNTINKFNTIGTFITKWGSEGSADGL
jgi:DNA-binding beta-propeller fold protein YncE